jgi:peptide-methionine (S)-S-oxide reductase
MSSSLENSTSTRVIGYARPVLLIIALLALTGIGLGAFPSAAKEGRAIPAPALDEPHDATFEVAVLAGGCFWGVQGVYQHVRGVANAVSGYSGGDKETAQYETVSMGTTAHAESVKITFDPRKITYGRLLQIYFSVAHDPTELNRQGPDAGTQYRSAIFPVSTEQARIAKAYITQLNDTHAFDAPIVTVIEPGQAFFPAEGYHQDFLTRNPTYPYIVINDLPKIEALKRLFPDSYRVEPVLVATAGSSN